ncbi:molybdopterin-dependent oxidoreductase [Streptomyces coelicoflavus]|uniref:molybdopterin-dependent oxidoreductase n=1 Tax=Streptomyces TaxID=1883 RepID=UPI001290F95D|nr:MULTISPECIES: molybdopterin-dependent oxidoreductase [Streptomyces]MBQ0951252.1 molybdopterin-dependent oxidoreductase [Streptomyces sp. RK76]MDI6520069.1 molybdopterin-dependent oxidoreductase [Streptomyces coelicoflavus]QFX86636.1 molybdopterin-dependent oxidoreductase [Streptomyces sp. SYP-A7193]
MSDSPSKVPSPLPGPKGDPSGAPVGRRVLLGMLGLGALGVAAGGPIQDVVAKGVDTVAKNDPTGLSDLLPGNRFRYYTVTSNTPEMDETTYRLRVDGMVDREKTYRLSDLAALPQTRLVQDVQCVTGWRVPKTPFAGVRLSALLDAAGVSPEAKAIQFRCFDGAYTESLTLEQARRPDVLVATSMEDKPVTHAHGGPVRLYVAPMYFYKSAKWLSGITVTDEVVPGYWEQRGYDVDAWVGRSNGRTDAPTV